MRRALRTATLILSALAIQLSLTGFAAACPRAMHGASGAGAAMSGAPASAATTATTMAATMAAGHDMADPAGAPCNDGGMLPTCRVAVSCTSSVSLAAPRSAAPAAASHDRALALATLEPPSLSLPPELPPPRA